MALVAFTLTTMMACSDSESDKSSSGSGTGAGSGVGGDNLGAGANIGGGSGDCPDCEEEGAGVGTENPFDPDNNPSDGVGLDDDGALVLDQSNTNIPGIIWIANTSLATITKVDTTTYQVLGRYEVGSIDPSRTSVNSLGDVFVGNRSGNSLTKVMAAGADCPDTNGDNAITTSTGFNDVLPLGQDDCVAWNVPVPNSPLIRGVAAQDVVVADPIPDDSDHTKIEHYVWVGGTNHRTLYKFDGDTGALLIQTEGPTGNYGMALDGAGNLWTAGRTDGNSNVLGRVDTTKCFDQASCDAAVQCSLDCTSGVCSCDPGCPTSCDDAVKERISLPSDIYGITVDFKQRVWLGGSHIQRYTPLAPIGQRFAAVPGTGFIHGIAADGDGSVWGASGGAVIRVDGDALNFVSVPVPGSKAIENGANAHVITPGTTGLDDYVLTNAAVTGLGQCYTYSDMTGAQLALATNDPGYYRQIFEGCDGENVWWELSWDVDVLPNTSVKFRGRTADMASGLDQATWVPLAKIPPDQSPANILGAFDAKGIALEKFLEIEVSLQGSVGLDGIVSPRVNSFGVSHFCSETAN